MFAFVEFVHETGRLLIREEEASRFNQLFQLAFGHLPVFVQVAYFECVYKAEKWVGLEALSEILGKELHSEMGTPKLFKVHQGQRNEDSVWVGSLVTGKSMEGLSVGDHVCVVGVKWDKQL